MRSCKMSKMHYQLIATVIANMTVTSPKGVTGAMSPRFKRIVAEAFASELMRTNSLFDRERFLEACVPKGPTGPKGS